jgi:hypothetical protein
MKISSLAGILLLGLSHSVFGQTYTTNFTGGYDAAVFTEVNAMGPSFALKNPDTGGGEDFLNYYTTVAPTGFEQVFLNYADTAPNNTQDFAVSVFTENYAGSAGLTASVGSFAQIGLNINDSDLVDGFNLYNGAYSFSGSAASDFYFFDGTNVAQALNFSLSGTLLAEFSAATQTFAFSYATDVTFVSFATLNIDGTGAASAGNFVEDWDMASGALFDISIYAGSNILIPEEAAGVGYLNVDAFGLNTVPEPSAYALLLGLVAIGATTARRRC